MAKMNEKNLIIVTLSLTILPTFVFLYFLYSDYKVWQETKAATAVIQEDIQRKNDDIKKIPGIKRDLDAQASQFEEDVKILPGQKDLENLQVNFRELANKADITNIEEFIPQKSARATRDKKATDFNEHTYTLKFTANYKTLAEFINAIETNTRFLQVTRFLAEPIKARGGSGTPAPASSDDLNCELKVTTYSYAKKFEADAVYQPVPGVVPPPTEGAALPVEAEVYIARSSWRSPFKNQLRDKKPPTDQTAGGPDTPPPTTSIEPDKELAAQQQQIDLLQNRLRGLEQAFAEKRYGDIIGKLDEYEAAWAQKVTFTDERMRNEAEQINESYKLIKKNVLEDMVFIEEWATLRLEEIEETFRIADRSNKRPDYEKVVDENKKMRATLEHYLGKDARPNVVSVMTRAQEFSQRAEVRLEFKDLPLKVVGVVYLFSPQLRDQSRAVVLYNGNSVELDFTDYVGFEENPNLRLHSMTEDGVIFQYKGELINKPLEEEDDEDEPAKGRGQPRKVGPGARGGVRR